MLTFAQALDDASSSTKRHLLLGNGFSIACRPDIFLYGRLYENADFTSLSPTAKLGFEALATQDFERVIKALRDAAKILAAYGIDPSRIAFLSQDADALRELLVQTIAASHPAWPGELTEEEFASCRAFIAPFDTIYTFNYDLLLYWVQMHSLDGETPTSDDGFRKDEDNFDASYVVWEPSQSHEQNMYFLHGALHVFDSGTEIQKYTWLNTGVRLIDQIRNALGKGLFPIFVSEGTSAEKLERIRHNDYLAKAYRSFSEITGSLYIYGHSLAQNDEHYLKRIEKGKVSKLYVGIYGDPDSPDNKRIVQRASQMTLARPPRRPLKVHFFDASTAKVWSP